VNRRSAAPGRLAGSCVMAIGVAAMLPNIPSYPAMGALRTDRTTGLSLSAIVLFHDSVVLSTPESSRLPVGAFGPIADDLHLRVPAPMLDDLADGVA
jgi:hypothetical protein